MPRNDPSDLCPPMHYKPRRVARPLTHAEIKAAVDRAEARSRLTVDQTEDSSDSSAPKPVAVIMYRSPRLA